MRNFLFLLKVILSCVSTSESFLIMPSKGQTAITVFLTKGTDQEPENHYATAAEKFNARWHAMFERLKEYKEEYGDCLVPQRYEDDPQLGKWVSTQRSISSLDDKAKKERDDKLNSIGFVWSVREAGRSSKRDKMWNKKFQRLKKYKQKHGDCLVSQSDKEDPSLGRWVEMQRKVYANNKLRSDRRSKLESVGFVWVAGETLTSYEKQWEEMFAKLEQYSRHHGDCLVPQFYKEDPALGDWVSYQRQGRDNLDSERVARLESIGFVWDALDRKWEEMFAKLEEYCRENGDCLVPRVYKEDPSLGRWVSKQRIRRDKLDPTRRERLESIGFVWQVSSRRRVPRSIEKVTPP